MSEQNADYAAAHDELWRELRDTIAASIKNPDQAQYAANRLLEYPAGQDLIKRLAAHIDSSGSP